MQLEFIPHISLFVGLNTSFNGCAYSATHNKYCVRGYKSISLNSTNNK